MRNHSALPPVRDPCPSALAGLRRDALDQPVNPFADLIDAEIVRKIALQISQSGDGEQPFLRHGLRHPSRVRFWTAGSPETRKKFATVFMVDDLDGDGVAHTEGKLHHRLALADHLVPEMLPDPETNTGRLSHNNGRSR